MDFVKAVDYTIRQSPQKEEAKEFIFDFLRDGEKEVSDLDEMAATMSISKSTLARAKADMKKEGKIKYRSCGYGQSKKFFITLIDSEKMSE